MKFFISYSRSVKQEVGQVIKLLKEAGHEVWWDGDIPTIADWWATILTNIEWCDIFIFMVSEKSVQSAYCLAELRYALARNRPLLPFIMDDHTRYTIPPELGRRQWLVYQGDPDRMQRQILHDCENIDFKKYADMHAPRPIEPNTGAGTLAKQFQQGVSLAESGLFEEALRHFRNVASLDENEWGEECQQWVARIQRYAEIADLADHKATFKRAHSKWEAYLNEYDADFDPFNVRAKLTPAAPAKPVAPSPAVPTDFAPPWQPTKLKSAHSLVYDILPAPFGWIEIPAGNVTITNTWDDDNKIYLKKGESQTYELTGFAIAKYPVTNAQYTEFIRAKGYREKKWWTEAGWQQREKENWSEPRYWQDAEWNMAQQPVVGVSWYEAVAFCHWLSEISGEKIMLPAEQHWQWAAQGDAKRIYPWGNVWDGTRCNHSVSPQSSKTTKLIRLYEDKGNSPFGVVDMAGNMWEWCRTSYHTGSQDLEGASIRSLRGGSWNDNHPNSFSTIFRMKLTPDIRISNTGFRIARNHK
jgi:formylglycine-generating enzyme required for sulfatase activity